MRFRVPAHLKGDRAIEEKIAQLNEALETNPLYAYNNAELSQKVHTKQLEFNAVKAPPLGTKAMIAGGRSGKTFCCIADDVIQLVPRDDVPPHLLHCKKFDGPIDIWVGAPKLSKHEDTILPLFRKLIPKNQLIDGSFDKSYSSQARKLTLVCGSNVYLKTYDQDLDAWASAAVHRIHWDEEPATNNSYRLRNEARQRLISTGGDEIIGMTPLLTRTTWALSDVYEKRHEPQITVMGMSMQDNPWNSAEAIEQFLSGLPEEERRAREKGEFVHFGGLFFDEFTDNLHVIDPPPMEEIAKQEIVVSIDPGLRHTAVTWSAWDSDNSGVFFAELFTDRTDVSQIAAEIKRRNREWKLPEPTYIIDPSYRNLTTAIHADAVQANYAREDIYVQPGNNDRRAGIMEIKKRLQAKDTKGDPSPTVLWSKNCPEHIRQMEHYRRDPNASDEWQAVPQDAHTRFDLVDSGRYAVMSRTWAVAEDVAQAPPSYEYGFEPSYDPAQYQADAPPMGDLS